MQPQPVTSSGEWADKRLRDAFHLIAQVFDEHRPDTDLYDILKDALDNVEDADLKLERLK